MRDLEKHVLREKNSLKQLSHLFLACKEQYGEKKKQEPQKKKGSFQLQIMTTLKQFLSHTNH